MNYQAQSALWKLDSTFKNGHSGQPLQNIRAQEPRILGRFRQVFPLTIFPDELIIERHRIVWIINKGPWIKEMISTMATDIASVDSSTGPLLGHIHVKSLTGGPEIFVDRLSREDVYKARFLLEGVICISRQGEIVEKDTLEAERAYFINKGQIN